MPKKRFSEEQIAFALRQAESGTPVGDICRKMGVADATFYRWKKVYAGMGVSEIRRLKQLEEGNAKLKRLVADLTLDKSMLQDACEKSGEARRSPRSYPALSGCLRIIGTAGLRSDGLWAGVSPLPVAAGSGIGAADAVEGFGRKPGPLWISPAPCLAPAGGVAGEPQAHLPALQ